MNTVYLDDITCVVLSDFTSNIKEENSSKLL